MYYAKMYDPQINSYRVLVSSELNECWEPWGNNTFNEEEANLIVAGLETANGN